MAQATTTINWKENEEKELTDWKTCDLNELDTSQILQRLKSANQSESPALKEALIARYQMHVVSLKVKDWIQITIKRNEVFGAFVGKIVSYLHEVMRWKEYIAHCNMVTILTTLLYVIIIYDERKFMKLSEELNVTKYKHCVTKVLSTYDKDDDDLKWTDHAPDLFQLLLPDIKEHIQQWMDSLPSYSIRK